MSRLIHLGCMLALVFAAANLPAAPAPDEAKDDPAKIAAKPEFKKGQHAYSFTHKDVKTDFLLYLPPGHGAKGKSFPVIFFLHGAGERGADVQQVAKHGPPKLVETMKDVQQFIVLSPQCPAEQRWSNATMIALLDHVVANTQADKERVYLTGLSMGGHGTWSMSVEYPDRFAAIVPICGWGDPAKADKIKHIPTWVFHGDMDKSVPFERSKAMVEALEKLGAKPKFTIYPGVGHDSWTQSYTKPELYKWLLEQKLKGAQKKG